MEHPTVIHELDRLIESYKIDYDSNPGWVSRKFKALLRATTPAQQKLILNHFPLAGEFSTILPQTLAATHLLLHLLEHPHLQDKSWVLKLLFRVPIDNLNRRRRLENQQAYQMMYRALPLMLRFLTHHKAVYRAHAAHLLSHFVYSAPQMISHLLERLDRERSPHVIVSLLHSINDLVMYRNRRIVTPALRAKLLAYTDRLLRSSSPLVRLSAATLSINLFSNKTPHYVFEVASESWQHLDASQWPLMWSTADLLDQIRWLDDQMAFSAILSLLTQTRKAIMVYMIWDTIRPMCFRDHLKRACRVAITLRQKYVLEALLDCRSFWNLRYLRDELHSRGFEDTQRGLRQQLQHVHIIAEDAFVSQWEERDLPLKLDTGLLYDR